MNATSASSAERNVSTAHITLLLWRMLMPTVAGAPAPPSQRGIVGTESKLSRPFALLLGSNISFIFPQKLSSIFSCFIVLGTTPSNYMSHFYHTILHHLSHTHTANGSPLRPRNKQHRHVAPPRKEIHHSPKASYCAMLLRN